MTWKKWPYWVRGGVIAGVFVLMSALATDLCELLTTPPIGNENLGLQCIPFTLPWIPFWSSSVMNDLSYLSFTLIGILVWSLIGCIIGILFSLIKK